MIYLKYQNNKTSKQQNNKTTKHQILMENNKNKNIYNNFFDYNYDNKYHLLNLYNNFIYNNILYEFF